MRFDWKTICLIIPAVFLPGLTSAALGATIPVTNWAVLVGTSTVTDGSTNSPTFAPADGIQVAGGFDTVNLADGDFIQGKVSVEFDRTSSGGMGDNVRIALFREHGGGNPTAGDGTGYSGISFALQHSLRDHRNPVRAQPFSSGGSGAPTVIVNPAGTDPEGDTVSGQNVTLDFTLNIIRDGNALDISGTISDGADYSQSFTVEDYVPDTSFMTGIYTGTDVFSWNRMAFLFAAAVDGTSVQVVNARVRSNLIIPEPSSALLMIVAMAGLVTIGTVRTRRESFGR